MKNILNNDLYFLVNTKNKEILGEPKPLELNWKNISGLSFLTDEELCDLTWAGQEDYGFIKFSEQNIDKIKEYECNEHILLQFKSRLKTLLNISRIKYEKNGLVVNNEYLIKLDHHSKILFSMKYLQCISNKDLSFSWETSSGYKIFNSLEFMKLYEKIMDFIQSSIDIKIEYFKKIDSCKSMAELILLDVISIKWNSNEIII